MAGACLECVGQLGVNTYLHAGGGARCGSECGPADRDPHGLAEVVAAFGLVGEGLDVLLGEFVTCKQFRQT